MKIIGIIEWLFLRKQMNILSRKLEMNIQTALSNICANFIQSIKFVHSKMDFLIWINHYDKCMWLVYNSSNFRLSTEKFDAKCFVFFLAKLKFFLNIL